MAKEGRKPKDKSITDNFNQKKLLGLSKKELAAAKKIAAAEAKKKKLAAELLRKERAESKRLEKEALKLGLEKLAKENVAKAEDGEPPAGPPAPSDEENVDAAYQMLQDMRWVYRKVKGRKKLKQLIDDDDKQFVFMVKELMKIESQMISAKIRSKEDPGGNQTVFVVLKGLAEEKQYEVEDPLINMKQIQHVIQPEAGEFQPEKEEEKVEVVL